jgi:glucokinase
MHQSIKEVYMKYTAAVDIGGTNTRVALVSEDYEIIKRIQFRTDAEDPFAVLHQIKEAVDSFEKKIVGVGMSCPGPLDLINSKVLTPPNLHGRWHGLEIVRELEELLGIPVFLENDANLAALAEAVLGEGKDYNIVQFLTISTGIGAGLVIHRQIMQGAHGFANEIANTCMWHEGPSHGSIYPGGIEAISSGTAIRERAKKAGLDISHAEEVSALAEKGNAAAKKIMDEARIYLAHYIAGVQAFIDPDIIILGGSVALKTPGFTEEVERLVKEQVYPDVRQYVKIRNSTLGDDSGLKGAACLCFLKAQD